MKIGGTELFVFGFTNLGVLYVELYLPDQVRKIHIQVKLPTVIIQR